MPTRVPEKTSKATPRSLWTTIAVSMYLLPNQTERHRNNRVQTVAPRNASLFNQENRVKVRARAEQRPV